ncbi:MAG: NAD kinase [Desulfovibrio sp.]
MSREHVRTIALCSKAESAQAEGLRNAMCRWFSERCVPCVSFVYDHGDPDFFTKIEDVDLILVLGGDGTFISVARRLAANPKPILGVNLGRVGFLAEVPAAGWDIALTGLIANGVSVEKGLVLEYALYREGNVLQSGLAVNDLVVSRGGAARLVSLALTVDGRHLAVLRADGFIVSSPTGSTGYTGSARGPLLHPGLDAYALTPICPFMSNFLPMVVSGETRFSITVEESGSEIYLTVDGQESLRLQEGDSLHVTGKAGGIRFARIDDEGYFAKLRFAGFVRDFSK